MYMYKYIYMCVYVCLYACDLQYDLVELTDSLDHIVANM
jgi:hypothetical protein